MKRMRTFAVFGVLAVVTLVGVAWAATQVSIPGDIEPLAYLSPVGPGFEPGVIQDGTTAVIVFYRSPDCIPEDFNLMDWFDGSLDPADCPMLLEGHGLLTDPDSFPMVTYLSGRDVPMWFFDWAELEDAMGDGVLTIGELESLESRLVGTASKYVEDLHFRPPHPIGHTTAEASGKLEDGRTFKVLAVEYDLEWRNVQISIK